MGTNKSENFRHDVLLTIRENISNGLALLSGNVLVGQGYVCALEDGSMAVRRVGGIYRLWAVTGTMSGISHWNIDDARQVAKSWNSNTDMKVRVVHYRDLIQEAVARWCEMVDELEAHDVETQEPGTAIP